jgi:hypothetical protein
MTEALGIIKTYEQKIADDGSRTITLNDTIKVDIDPEGNVVAHARVQRGSRAAPRSKKLNATDNYISVHGVKIELTKEGGLIIYTKGSITVEPVPGSGAAPVVIQEAEPALALKIGQKMKDGTIFAGISPDNGRQMFVTRRDLRSLTCKSLVKFDDLKALTAKFNRSAKKNCGHDDWRVPSTAELDVLYENCEKGFLRKSFNRLGGALDGWYWSSRPDGEHGAWSKRFSDGQWRNAHKGIEAAVRLVRG